MNEFTPQQIEQLQAMMAVGMKAGFETITASFKEVLDKQQSYRPDYFTHLRSQEPIVVEDPAEKGMVMARIVRATAAGKMLSMRPLDWALKAYGEKSAVVKALAASDPLAGGSFVPPGYRAEWIEFLRPASVVRSLNPTIWPMPNGTAQVPKLTGGGTAAYVGENQNIAVTAQTTGQLNLSQKKLAAIVVMSNDVWRYTSPAFDTVVRNDMIAAVAQREDLAFIRGDGLSDTPKGLLHWAHLNDSTQYLQSAGTSLANVRADLASLELALYNANTNMSNPGWIMSPRTEVYLKQLADGNGNLVYEAEMNRGMLKGYPFRRTTQIPNTLGSGNKSEIYFCNFADFVIGESEMLVVDTSMEAAYYDGAAIQAAYSKDQTVVRILEAHDCGMRHDTSIAILYDCAYGA